MKSVFSNKEAEPSLYDLKKALGSTYDTWQELADHVVELYPAATKDWKFSGEKFGWSFRVKDKKRVVLYLLPRDKFFKVAFVFGQKATDHILKSGISENIKAELRNAKVYAEGRGIRIDVNDGALTDDIKKLIAIKISN